MTLDRVEIIRCPGCGSEWNVARYVDAAAKRAGRRDDWPLAIAAVFGVDVATPDEFVAWVQQQNLSWEAP